MKINKQKGNSWIGVIIIIALIWGISSLFSKDEVKSDSLESNAYESTYPGSSYNGYDSDSYNYQEEPENPYDDGSGHYAGYEWAMENEPSECGGNSDSFIEGCQEYLDEMDAYNEENYEE
jgi:hypothetical protein